MGEEKSAAGIPEEQSWIWRLFFFGHHHNYDRNEAYGITYIINGGGRRSAMCNAGSGTDAGIFAVVYDVVLLEIDGNHPGAEVFSSQGRILNEFEQMHLWPCPRPGLAGAMNRLSCTQCAGFLQHFSRFGFYNTGNYLLSIVSMSRGYHPVFNRIKGETK